MKISGQVFSAYCGTNLKKLFVTKARVYVSPTVHVSNWADAE